MSELLELIDQGLKDVNQTGLHSREAMTDLLLDIRRLVMKEQDDERSAHDQVLT